MLGNILLRAFARLHPDIIQYGDGEIRILDVVTSNVKTGFVTIRDTTPIELKYYKFKMHVEGKPADYELEFYVDGVTSFVTESSWITIKYKSPGEPILAHVNLTTPHAETYKVTRGEKWDKVNLYIECMKDIFPSFVDYIENFVLVDSGRFYVNKWIKRGENENEFFILKEIWNDNFSLRDGRWIIKFDEPQTDHGATSRFLQIGGCYGIQYMFAINWKIIDRCDEDSEYAKVIMGPPPPRFLGTKTYQMYKGFTF